MTTETAYGYAVNLRCPKGHLVTGVVIPLVGRVVAPDYCPDCTTFDAVAAAKLERKLKSPRYQRRAARRLKRLLKNPRRLRRWLSK